MQIGRAADQLSGKAPGTLEQDGEDFSATLRVEGMAVALDQLLQARQALDLVRLGEPGRGEYLNENAAA